MSEHNQNEDEPAYVYAEMEVGHESTFYCVFCQRVKDYSEHGGQTKDSFDDICQACLDRDD